MPQWSPLLSWNIKDIWRYKGCSVIFFSATQLTKSGVYHLYVLDNRLFLFSITDHALNLIYWSLRVYHIQRILFYFCPTLTVLAPISSPSISFIFLWSSKQLFRCFCSRVITSKTNSMTPLALTRSSITETSKGVSSWSFRR